MGAFPIVEGFVEINLRGCGKVGIHGKMTEECQGWRWGMGALGKF